MHYYTSLLLTPSFNSDADSSSAVASTSAATIPRPLEAAKHLLQLAIGAREGTYTSPEGKSGYQLLVEWMNVCEKYAEEVGIDLEESEKRKAERLAHELAAAKDKAAVVVGGEEEVNDAVIGKGKGVELLRLGALTTNGSKAAAAVAGSTPSTTAVTNPIDPISPTQLDVSHLLNIHGILHYPDQSGPLYTSLATYWIKRAEFDHARQIFEAAYQTVVTLRDFSIVFDAGVEFEESVISSLLETIAEEVEADDDPEEAEEERKETEEELNGRMEYFEQLMDRRPFLVNEVLLRRNPNDVQEWEKRVVLHGDDTAKVRCSIAIHQCYVPF